MIDLFDVRDLDIVVISVILDVFAFYGSILHAKSRYESFENVWSSGRT